MNKVVLEGVIGSEIIKEMNGTMAHNQNMDLKLANKSSVQPRYMSVKSAGTYLGVSSRTIYRWIDKGLIPYCTIPSGYRFDVMEIDRWMKTHHVPEAGLPEIKVF